MLLIAAAAKPAKTNGQTDRQAKQTDRHYNWVTTTLRWAVVVGVVVKIPQCISLHRRVHIKNKEEKEKKNFSDTHKRTPFVKQKCIKVERKKDKERIRRNKDL